MSEIIYANTLALYILTELMGKISVKGRLATVYTCCFSVGQNILSRRGLCPVMFKGGLIKTADVDNDGI